VKLFWLILNSAQSSPISPFLGLKKRQLLFPKFIFKMSRDTSTAVTFGYTVATRAFLRRVSFEWPLNQGCHLAFLKLFARNKMVWPFGHFFGLFEC
jgi:hypothetical protein